MKSDIQIKDDIYNHVIHSPLAASVTGKVCKTGVRPKGSTAEDIVISVLANEWGQLQEAIVNVNVYVADDHLPNGQSQEATLRLRTLCTLAATSLQVGCGSDYRFIIDTQRVIAVPDTNEHVINNKLKYKQINE